MAPSRRAALLAAAAAAVALAQPSPPRSSTPSSTATPLGVSTLCTPGLGIIRFPDGELFGRFGSTVSTRMTVNDTTLVTSSSGACLLPPSSQLGYRLTLPAEVVLGEGQLVVNTCTSALNTLLAVGSGCPYSLENFQCAFWNDNTPGCGSGGTGSQITINGPNLTSLVYYVIVGSQNRGQLAFGGMFTLQWTYYATIPSISPTRSITATGSQTLSSTATDSLTLSSTATGSHTRSITATGSQTRTGTPTPSQTPSTTGSVTTTPSITGSPSVTPSNSKTSTGSRTGASTRSSTATSTASSTATSSVSATRTPAGTASETATATGSTSGSRTGSITVSLTAGAVPSASPSCLVGGQRTLASPGPSGEVNISLVPGRRADASGGVCGGRFLDPALPSHMLLLNMRAGVEPWGAPPAGGALYVDVCALNSSDVSARAGGPNVLAALGFGCPSSFVNYRCQQSWSGPRNPVPGPPREPCPAGSAGLSFAYLK